MELLEAVKIRHSVRSYQKKPIDQATVKQIQTHIQRCNELSGLHAQLCLHEPDAIKGLLAHYGRFHNACNYIALIGRKQEQLEELCGYYGEELCLHLSAMGLSSCWIGATYRKGKISCCIDEEETLVCILAFGYGESDGVPHKSKPMEKLCRVDQAMPSWFQKGMECVMLAPTALNQQKFLFILEHDVVEAKALHGPFSKVDLGIVKYHFELGAGTQDWTWKK